MERPAKTTKTVVPSTLLPASEGVITPVSVKAVCNARAAGHRDVLCVQVAAYLQGCCEAGPEEEEAGESEEQCRTWKSEREDEATRRARLRAARAMMETDTVVLKVQVIELNKTTFQLVMMSVEPRTGTTASLIYPDGPRTSVRTSPGLDTFWPERSTTAKKGKNREDRGCGNRDQPGPSNRRSWSQTRRVVMHRATADCAFSCAGGTIRDAPSTPVR